MPIRLQKTSEIFHQVIPLAFLCIGLVGSNVRFTVIDDETLILAGATQPVQSTFALFWSGVGQHQHPPLYDLLLHFWLRWSGGAFNLLRIPSILFYLGGLYVLAQAAARLGGPRCAQVTAWLGALWPFGFHFGRLATWYSFSFLLVSGLTLAYLRYVEDPTGKRWAWFYLLGVALLWTNYFGWAILVGFAIDQFFRHRGAERAASVSTLIRTGALFFLAFLPLFRAFLNELGFGINFHTRALSALANAAFCFYSLFVSESVAPWHWLLSIPAGLAVLACLGLVATALPSGSRRFLVYGLFLIALMSVSGFLLTKRMLLVSPWILLPIAVATGTAQTPRTRAGLPVVLVIIGGVGWYGIYSRNYYSAPRFIEPWPQVAEGAARKIRGGATLIANNPSFFFYLTYALRAPEGNVPWKFAGVLPDQVTSARVYSTDTWLASGHPIGEDMLWIRGMGGPQLSRSMDSAAQELGRACVTQTSQLMMHDDGYEWKRRFFPELGELQWRIEIRDYVCHSSGSQGIYGTPTH